MKKGALLLFFVIFGLFSANAQKVEWAKSQDNYIGWAFGTWYQSISANKNSVAIISSFRDTIHFNNQTLIAPGNNDLYLAKYSSAGLPLWIKHIKTDKFNTGAVDIAFDLNGNIIITSQFEDSVIIENTTYFSNAASKYNCFIAKFDVAGNLIWLETINGSAYFQFFDVETDQAGNIIVAGASYGPSTLNFNTASTLSFQGFKTFLAKYNPAGNLTWAKIVGTHSGTSISITKSGNIYFLGRSLMKFDAAGSVKWRTAMPDSNTTTTQAYITSDTAGNIYIGGNISKNTTFGSIQLQTASNCLYLAKADSSGNWLWADKASATNAVTKNIVLDSLNNIYLAGHFSEKLIIGNATFNQTSRWDPTNGFVAKYSSTGNPVWAHQVIGGINAVNNFTEDYKGYLYLLGEYRRTVSLGNAYLSADFNKFGSYLYKIDTRINSLTGTVFIDTNNNGIKDSGELPYPNALIKSDFGETYLNASSDGNYATYLPAGTFNFALHQPANHYTFIPQNHTVSFSGLNQTQTKDFALAPIPNRNDVQVTVTNVTPARPGFPLRYRLTFRNDGTTTHTDSVMLHYNAANLTFGTASVSPDLLQTGKLSWFFQALQPTEIRNIDIDFTIAASTPINTNQTVLAVIKPILTDFIPANNYDTLIHPITGSYDPNDKLVNHQELTPLQVASSKSLEYIVRFQNTGTDTAFTVIIIDSVSGKLNLSSFELLSASHPYTFRYLDNNMAEWRFSNIRLPHSTRNEPASHGFIRYRIKPKTNLTLGDEIKSRAAIYFDYNVPILTNYAITRIQNITGIKEKNMGLTTFNLFPNPAKDFVMIETELTFETPITLKITNLLGQQVFEKQYPKSKNMQTKLETGRFTKGVYLLSLQMEKGIVTKRLVVQ